MKRNDGDADCSCYQDDPVEAGHCPCNCPCGLATESDFDTTRTYVCDICPPPSTAAPDSPDSCFPSHAKVNLENGKSLTMSELQVGDKIKTGFHILCIYLFILFIAKMYCKTWHVTRWEVPWTQYDCNWNVCKLVKNFNIITQLLEFLAILVIRIKLRNCMVNVENFRDYIKYIALKHKNIWLAIH